MKRKRKIVEIGTVFKKIYHTSNKKYENWNCNIRKVR